MLGSVAKKRQRASGPRSRIGCLNCKLRRVKCGEERPECLRCERYGVLCEGYPDPDSNEVIGKNKTKKRVFTHQIVPILPRSHTKPANGPLDINLRHSVVASSSPFRNSEQHMYFLYFQEETVRDLSGPIDDGLWSHLALQACYDEPLLMNLVIAAGALGKSRKMAITSHPESRVHKEKAFINYGQALKTIRKRFNGPDPVRPRIILISSLLIYYLENLTGDVETACAHMRSALLLVNEQLSKGGTNYRHHKPSSSETNLEDVLVAAFVRLDNMLCENPGLLGMVQGDQRLEIDFDIPQLPSKMKSLSEARKCLEAIHFHELPLISREMAIVNPSERSAHGIEILRGKLAMALKWESAYLPLYKECAAPRIDGSWGLDHLTAAIMRVQVFSGRILVEGALQEYSAGLTSTRRECMEALGLAKQIAEDPNYIQLFAFGHSIGAAVFCILITRVDKQVEERAVEVLTQLADKTVTTHAKGKKIVDKIGEWYWATKYLEQWKHIVQMKTQA